MKLYTSYFAKLKSLSGNQIPIAICAGVPKWFTGYTYKALAPSYSILMQYKTDGDIKAYEKRYYEEILDKLPVDKVITDFEKLAAQYEPDTEFILVCYEKPSDFCHRHLIAKWLTDNGIPCTELKFDKE